MLTDDEAAELADLRRRAWGEDADILDDPAALARLEELEDKAHPRHPIADPSTGSGTSVVAEPVEASRTNMGDDPSTGSGTKMVAEPVEASRTNMVAERVEGSRTGMVAEPVEASGTNMVAEPVEASRTGARRRRRAWLAAGGIAAVVVIATVGGSILTGRPSPSPSPTSSDAPRLEAGPVPAPHCGGGWGPEGTLDTPDGKPVWSRSFDQPPTSITVIPTRSGRMFAEWVNLDVRPNTVADVTVAKPETARLFYTDVATWTKPATPDEILANVQQSVILPTCPNGDSYPGLVLVPAPACVTLEFTIDGTQHYTVNTAVGIDEGARCPAP